MKKLLFIFFILLSLTSSATKYYISATGSDANSGLTPLLPKQTLTAVNALLTNAGDTVAFKKGDGWYGQLNITRSGSPENQTVYTTYGTGATPTITGFTTVSAWTNLGSNVWESTSAVSSLSTLNMVSINGVNTAMGRYPNQGSTNSGYLNFESHSSNTSITDNQLTDALNWTGAEVVVRPVRWILDRRTITGHTGGTLTFSALSYTPIDGFGYFIQNDARTLDVQNEWYYNPSTKKIKVYSVSEPNNVKVATIDDICTINASYIVIDGLKFEGSNDNLLTGNGTVRNGIQIKNCTISMSGGTVLNNINCENFLIHNNTVSNGNNNGISGGTADHVTITNNTISSIGLLHGMGTLIYSAISTGENSNVLIKNNSITSVGNNGISFYGDTTVVKNNIIDNYCSVLDDGGGIYTYTGNRTVMTNDTIYGNIVLNGVGAINGTSGNQSSTAIGIYLDNNSKNIEVAYNTVAHTNSYGMLMNNPSYINIHHNTFYDNSPHVRSTFMTGSNAVTNMTIANNLFVSKTGQGMVYLVSTEENLATFGTINNNIYSRPIDDTGNMFLTSQPSAAYVNRTFSGWKTYMSQDANSTQSPFSIATDNDIRFDYNATATTSTIILDQNYRDIPTNNDHTTYELLPYSSVVLLKHAAYPSTSGRKIVVDHKKTVKYLGNSLKY